LSFFDDDEETAPRPSSRAPRRPAGNRPEGAATPRRPRPRPPQHAGASGLDHHTLMVRRRVAFGVALVVLIAIVLLINGCLKSEKQQSLKDYNHEVSAIAQESNTQVAQPLFTALTDAAGKPALDVEQQVDELLKQAQAIATHAKGLSVPGEMASAQRALLLALDLRVEAMSKLTELLPSALGGQAKQASTKIAGDMEIFLASDVIYSQRVAPLIQQTLTGDGITGLSTASTRFLPNLGWLEAATVLTRVTGQASSTSPSGVAPGHHGSALKGVSVGTTTLEPEPALNHISGGSNPTFSVMIENAGEFPETDVKVEVTVTAEGKQIKESHVINTTEPAKTASVEIPIPGVPLGVPAKVEAHVLPVPGETNHEDTLDTFLAIFGE
jgi:hypothetical protein